MSPKTTPNAERPSADKLAASAGRAMASPAVSDKGPIPAIVEGLHLKSSRKRRQARADLVQLRQHAGSQWTCMGLFLSSGRFWVLLPVLCSERERPFFVPSPAIRFAERAEEIGSA